LLTAIHREGTGKGYDNKLTEIISNAVDVPVIACGGAGSVRDPADVVLNSGVSAVSMASILHYDSMEAVNTHTMTYDKEQLRMGESIDSGNIEFLREGYGGFSELMVEPCSISSIKEEMHVRNIPTRMETGAL